MTVLINLKASGGELAFKYQLAGQSGKFVYEKNHALDLRPEEGVMKQDISGTTIFDAEQAKKGFALNRMCFSFNEAENRQPSCAMRMPIAPDSVSRRSSAGPCSIAMYWK